MRLTTRPNIDGQIDVTDEYGTEIGTFRVQVKKLWPENAPKMKHYFTSNKFLAYCRESADWTPILFIGVDLERKKAFWLHMDRAFLDANGSRRTVKFIGTQVIESGANKFIDDWEKIIKRYRSNSKEFERYKKAYSMLSDIVVNPAYRKVDERFVNIHYFLDELNDYLDHKFPIVKQVLYPKTWKLGFAFFNYGSTGIAYTLYPIALNKNDVQIKEIDGYMLDKIATEGLNFTYFNSVNPLETSPKKYAREVIQSKTSDIVKQRWLKHSGSEYLAKEFIFAFIDEFHIPMGLELKDKYSLDEIERAIDEYLPLWLKFSHDLLLRKKREPEGTIMECTPDWVHNLTESERNEIAQNVERVIQDDTFDFRIMLRREVETSLMHFWEFLDYLKHSKKKEIERLYILERHSSSKYIDHNLKMFCEHLLEAYNTVLQNNFPLLKDELSLFGKADTILISRKVKDHPDEPTDYWGAVSIYQSRENIKGERAQTYLVTEEELEQSRKASEGPFGEIIFRDKKYWFTSTDFIYEGAPMLNFIYEKLKKRIDEYFKKKEPSPKFYSLNEADWGER